ncbi:MAG: hypothetical protein ACREUX_07600 [Burkholderiales bacterium]
MPTLQYYVDANNRSTFGEWFEELDAEALARVTVALVGLEQGKLGNTKAWGLVSLNTGSTLGRAIEFISAGMATH